MAHDPSGSIGRNIRQRRRALGLSLEALASRSGVSSTMLSEVERSTKNPTVKLAYQIARALGCSLTDLLDEPAKESATVIRADERRCLEDPDAGVVRYGVTTQAFGPGMEFVWYDLAANSSTGEMSPNRAGMIEFLTVIEGELTFRIGETEYKVGPGDSVTYGPQSVMEYRNDGAVPCRIVMLVDRTKAT